MAFDRTNQADLTALKTEVDTDPIGMGYAAVLNSTAQLLQLLNDPANNVGGDTAAREFTVEALLEAIDAAEYAGNPVGVGGRGYTDMLVMYGSNTGASLEPFKAKLQGLYQINGNTNSAINAQTAPLSRAEVLFGQGTEITRDDWFAARDNG